MKSFLRILVAPILWLIQACSPLGKQVDIEVSNNFYYSKDETDIIYCRMGNWFELGKTPLKADVKSFEVLNSHLGKDRKQAYYQSHVIRYPELDLKSFDASLKDWMWHIGFDENRVYVFDEDIVNGEFQVITKIVEGADPDTFYQYDMNWGRDSSNHFYRYQLLSVDYQTFEIVNNYFAVDQNQVYLYYTDLFEIADDITRDSFQKIDDLYVCDSQYIFFLLDWLNGEELNKLIRLPYSSLNEVTVYNETYLKIDDRFYYRGQVIEGLIDEDIQVLSEEYIKDRNHVYYQNKLIDGADAESFHFDENVFSYRDKNHLYREDSIWQREVEKL